MSCSNRAVLFVPRSYDSDEHFEEPYESEAKKWELQYRDEIEELYAVYTEAGKMLFGGAFHQLGDINHFRRFVFKYMQVGAR